VRADTGLEPAPGSTGFGIDRVEFAVTANDDVIVVAELVHELSRDERTPIGPAFEPDAEAATEALRLVRIEIDAEYGKVVNLRVHPGKTASEVEAAVAKGKPVTGLTLDTEVLDVDVVDAIEHAVIVSIGIERVILDEDAAVEAEVAAEVAVETDVPTRGFETGQAEAALILRLLPTGGQTNDCAAEVIVDTGLNTAALGLDTLIDVEVGADGSERELPPGSTIVAGDAVVIPPVNTKQRHYDKVLGKYRLEMGNGYGIHGTDEPDKLGQSVSHGCVRVGDADIEKLYQIANVGDTVIIY